MPKKTKFRKTHKLNRTGRAVRRNKVSFGQFGMQAEENLWVTSRQIEAARRVISKFVERGGKIWIRVFPDKSVTAKGGEMPMGKGKGAVDHYVAIVKRDMMLFEIADVTEAVARQAFKLAAYKLPVKCAFVKRVEVKKPIVKKEVK